MSRSFVHLQSVVATTLDAEHALSERKDAAARYGNPVRAIADQGSQFTAQNFVHGVNAKLSMDARGAWRGNVFVERLWRSVKHKRVYPKSYDRISAAKADIAQRLH